MPYDNLTKSNFFTILLLTYLTWANSLFAAPDLPEHYGQVPWASVHRDSRNSDFSPLPTSADLVVRVSVLDGAALINPGVIDGHGNHFVTSARGPGFSHLHAFDRNGRLLWESAPQVSADDLDSHAGFNAPVIDVHGDIYVGDGNQLWAFHPDGTLKWETRLPEAGDPFVYQVISGQGYVGGITTKGKVLFYRRDTGEPAVPVFNLPAGKPVARLVSVISVSANHVWVGMNLGYDYHQPGTGLTLPIPHKTVVCALEPGNGE